MFVYETGKNSIGHLTQRLNSESLKLNIKWRNTLNWGTLVLVYNLYHKGNLYISSREVLDIEFFMSGTAKISKLISNYTDPEDSNDSLILG